MDRSMCCSSSACRLGSAVLVAFVLNAAAFSQTSPPTTENQLDPLAAKEQMIKDRFDRFRDRIYALSVDLSEVEPGNAARLARALERSGELGLSEKLDEIIQMLADPAKLPRAVDAQAAWLADADRLLNILLERDSDNERRRSEMERLDEYRRQIVELLDQQRDLRKEAGDATAAERLSRQLDQAMNRLDALLEDQRSLGDRAESAPGESEPSDLAAEQERLSQQAAELAEEIKRMGEPQGASEESPSLKEAREQTKSAGESTESGAKSMSQAGQEMQSEEPAEARDEQKKAEQALQKAKEKLEAAKEALESQRSSQEQSGEQKSVAQQTQQLGDQMKQEDQSGGQQGKSGAQQAQQSAQQKLDQAQKEMNDAAESLDQDKPDSATPSQDRAIEQLEEARRELEEQLQQLRKEERAEVLRDLEARFRDMLARQRPINEGTIELHAVGPEKFGRADQLRLAELSAQQMALSEDAFACLHILDEEGTTIAFPHVVGQLVEDMNSSANRLGQSLVGAVTQVIQKEILETLEQLLDAVKKMQQENEQGQQSGDSQDGGEPPLLPESAELRLLRASQERVNTRTITIETSLAQGEESPQNAESALKKLSVRQGECLDIAKDMRDQKP